ncbi:hypothetical protein B0T09DRAFT_101365 [Sordaria sp. MPI-SDFR-AT-0083]|nr:hypothetical protein B0T09DRAFT_101365 [Sordaria sp. MPI-SDFR-AT-0083]
MYGHNSQSSKAGIPIFPRHEDRARLRFACSAPRLSASVCDAKSAMQHVSADGVSVANGKNLKCSFSAYTRISGETNVVLVQLVEHEIIAICENENATSFGVDANVILLSFFWDGNFEIPSFPRSSVTFHSVNKLIIHVVNQLNTTRRASLDHRQAPARFEHFFPQPVENTVLQVAFTTRPNIHITSTLSTTFPHLARLQATREMECSITCV